MPNYNYKLYLASVKAHRMHGLIGKAHHVKQAATVLFLCLLFSGLAIDAVAQLVVRGRVVDHESDAPVVGATVRLPGTGYSTASDESGQFKLDLPSSFHLAADSQILVVVSAMGYHNSELLWHKSSHADIPLDVRMEKAAQLLDEVVVSQTMRYSNRNNPAVDLIRQVTAHRAGNRSRTLDYLQFNAYNKIVMAVSDLPGVVIRNPLFRKYDFIFENTDTISSPGRTLFPMYIEEKLSREYRRGRPVAEKSLVEASRRTELDERFVNNENIQAIVNFLHADKDLYENNLILFNRAFMSPIATGSHLFYKYAIRDTVQKENSSYIRVDFVPRNEQDRLFSGNLLISTDGRYAVREALLKISQNANINWINDMEIRYDFQRHSSGIYLPSEIHTTINFGVFGSRQGLYSRWIQHFDGYDLEAIPGSVFDLPVLGKFTGEFHKDDHYWQQQRPLALSPTEAQLYHNVDSLQHNRSFLNTLNWLSLLATSYKRAGSVELGPLENAYSYNILEGSRVRVGGRIGKGVSKRFFAEGYAAYGFRDDQFKYYGLAAISLNNREIAAFPAHYLSFSYQKDVREPGLPLEFLNGDDFFRSFRSDEQNRWLYHRRFRVQHNIEFGNHFSIRTTLAAHSQQTAGDLFFRRVADGALQPEIRTTEAVVEFRWAPHEKYFQSNLRRSPISGRYPIFNFRYNAGISGFLGGQYDYHGIHFDVSKRLYMSFLGFSEVEFGAGYVFGALPYPLLEIPMSDQSYLLNPESYSLMNNLEFVSDHYAKIHVTHRFQGFFINKIPLLRKTKIREIAGAKFYFGRLRDENNPTHNADLFYFPVNNEGQQSTFAFRRAPYVEASVGLENIFNFLQIEYVKRLSYLDLPDVRQDGVRFSVNVGF